MVSVIVPVYKAAQFLPRCIDSLLAQTYGDLEIVLVDDGSPDESGQICDGYSQKDSRIVVIHKENGGASSARNAGLEVARGEYVGFVDSDDWVEPNMFEELVREAEKVNADAVFYGFHVVHEDLENSYDIAPQKVTGKVSREMALNYLFDVVEKPSYNTSLCNKFFRRSVIGDVRFPVGVTMAEDGMFVTKVIQNCQAVCLFPKPLYHYCLRDGSATRNPGLTKQALDDVASLREILGMVGMYPKIAQAVSARVFLKSVYVMMHAYLMGKKEVLLEHQQIAKEHKKNHVQSPGFILRKAKYLLIYYAVCWRLPKKLVAKLGSIHQ